MAIAVDTDSPARTSSETIGSGGGWWICRLLMSGNPEEMADRSPRPRAHRHGSVWHPPDSSHPALHGPNNRLQALRRSGSRRRQSKGELIEDSLALRGGAHPCSIHLEEARGGQCVRLAHRVGAGEANALAQP